MIFAAPRGSSAEGVVWEVEVADEFVEWWVTLDVDQQAALGVRIDLLESGPGAGSAVGRSDQRIAASQHEGAARE